MQEELTALQPELIQTSAETDKMMVKIEGETVEVDAKKELVSADEKVANDAAAAAQAIKVYMYYRSHCTKVHNSCTLVFIFFLKVHINLQTVFKMHQTQIFVSFRMSVRVTWQKQCLHWRLPSQPWTP